jgi:integrase
MASIQNRNGSYKLTFCYHGKRHYLTLGKVSEQEAEAKSAQVDYLLLRIRQNLVQVPSGVPIEEFIQHDGKIATPEQAPAAPLSFAQFRRRYLETHRNGAIEANSLATVETHLDHFGRTLGDGFPMGSLSLGDLQRHVDGRARQKYRGKRISPSTIKKELSTLKAAWNWAERMGHVTGAFPGRGLVYPKLDEKPPFQTREEIERRVALGGLTTHQLDELWDSLFLQLPEVAELLEHVRKAATHPWIYPLVFFAAHTGARRSELLRCLVSDLDFAGATVLVREKKRARGKRTTRRVPLSPALASVLGGWLEVHPGGQFLFCHGGEVARSKKRSPTTGHRNGPGRPSSLKGRMATVTARERPDQSALTKDEVRDHFERVVVGSKWEVLKGLHVLRHSFISNCAARGVDQRLIDAWTGHQTEEMRKRYRHLIPSVEADAIRSVFG